MASNRLSLVHGTSSTTYVDLVDDVGNPIAPARLIGGKLALRVRIDPSGSDVLYFVMPDPGHLLLDAARSVATILLSSTEVDSLTVGGTYFYQLELSLLDGEVKNPIDWTPVDVTLGGSAAPTPPTFSNTVKLDHNYMLSDDMRYMSPGGSPIADAQIRVYYKSDYDAGKLSAPVGITMTGPDGRWLTGLLVISGYSYVVRFEKPNCFGPDQRTVTALQMPS